MVSIKEKREGTINNKTKKAYSQQEIADMLEIAQTTFSQYENGKRKIPVEIAKKLGKILKFDWKKIYE